MIKIGICDTDKEFIKDISGILEAVALRKNIQVEFETFSDSKGLMNSLRKGSKFDVVFLETHIGDECGVVLGKDIKSFNKKIELIYLSYTDKYVLDCFDMGAFNYILKPIDNPERLLNQFERLLIKNFMSKGDYLVVKKHGEIIKLSINKISYIETVGKLVRIHYEDRFVDINEKMCELEKKLEKLFFIRCHVSYIVNVRYILRVYKNELKLTDGKMIPVSRLRMKKLKEILEEFFENRDLV